MKNCLNRTPGGSAGHSDGPPNISYVVGYLPMSHHDHSYNLLFSHPEMVCDLLLGFVHEAWVAELDCSTLERGNASYISEDLRRREDDIIWRVRRADDWLYIYLLVAFQSQPDPWMAMRMLVYVGLLYQELIKGGHFTASGKLPPVFPLVLDNGEQPWRASDHTAELIEALGPWKKRFNQNDWSVCLCSLLLLR